MIADNINSNIAFSSFYDPFSVGEPQEDVTGIVIDIEVESERDREEVPYTEEWNPSIRDAVNFIIDELRSYVSEYMTPFNMVMIKLIAISLTVCLVLGVTVVGIIRTHISKEQEIQNAVSGSVVSAVDPMTEIAETARKNAMIAICSDVLGTWYEFDATRDDIRTMELEVDENAACRYSFAGERGTFSFRDGSLSMLSEKGDVRDLILKDNCLVNESTGASYYRTNANIESLKFAEFLKKHLPGTYQEMFGGCLYIYPDGKWQTAGPWEDAKTGEWSMEINEGCVLLIFEGMGVHFGGGNIYKVTIDDYDEEMAEISSGDFSLNLDINSYDRVSGKLP